MGQKCNPVGLRLGVNRTWDSRWYANKKEYGKLLQQDIQIRNYLMDKLKQAGVSRIVIERPHKKCRVTIHSARPGVVIGKKGADIEKLKSDLGKYTPSEIHLNIVEIRKPEIDAKLVADNIAQQLERRVAFRRAMKRAVQSAMRLGAQGIRINCTGRLGGAEIARVEWYREGRVPLHGAARRISITASPRRRTRPMSTCGVKVWVFKGEIMEHDRDGPGASARTRRPNRQAAAVRNVLRRAGKDNESCCNRHARNSANSIRAASTAPPRPAIRWRSAQFGCSKAAGARTHATARQDRRRRAAR